MKEVDRRGKLPGRISQVALRLTDGVDTGSVLHGEERNGNCESLEVGRGSVKGLDRSQESGASSQLVSLVGGLDLLHLLHDVRVVLRKVAEVRKVLAGSGAPALGCDCTGETNGRPSII